MGKKNQVKEKKREEMVKFNIKFYFSLSKFILLLLFQERRREDRRENVTNRKALAKERRKRQYNRVSIIK